MVSKNSKYEHQRELTKKEKEMILTYGEKIKTIELFVDSVRKNPGEYLSSIGNEGWMNCIREIFQNAVDEMMRPDTFCDTVWFTYDEVHHKCKVEDNGRALPPELITKVFTREHTSTNFEKAKGEYPSGLHGVGSKCVNAVSSRFAVYSYRPGDSPYYIEFSEGKPLKKFKDAMPKQIPNTINKPHGLIVEFEPDFSIMKTITVTCEDVLRLIANIVPLTKPNDKVYFVGLKANGQTINQTLHNQYGVMEYLIPKMKKPLIKPITYKRDTGEMKADIAVVWEPDLNTGPDVITFANMTLVNTQLSTPSQGFIRGVQEFFRNYMNKIFLATNTRAPEVVFSDVVTGLKAAVATAHMNVMFDGQAKNVCKNMDLFDFTKQLTIEALEEWVKQNPDDVQKLCTYFKDVASARIKADRAKIDITRKYKADNFLKHPKGYVKAERKENLELFIVEGLSARSPCETGRDSLYQALFAIRGKLPNAMSTSKEKFLKNEEIQSLLGIINCGYGKSFDITKCKFDKIIILTDADSDGYHIRVLILLFLLVYCKPLVEAGKVYVAISPLYHVNKGKKNWTYFTDKNDFIAYVQDQFSKNYEVINVLTKKKYTKSQLYKLLIDNNPYKDLMDHIADTYAIYPVLLEDLLAIRNYEYKKFKKFLENKYRFVTVSLKNGVRYIEGLVNEKSHAILMKDELLEACRPLTNYIDSSDKRYLINGQIIGLYELLKIFRDSEPKNIERTKGLGSMDAKEIGISTLDPKNRTLLRYTTKDIDNEINEMRKINDDKFMLIKDVDISEYEF